MFTKISDIYGTVTRTRKGRIAIAVLTLVIMVLAAGAPQGYGG